MSPDKDTFGVGIRGAGQVAYEHARAIEKNDHLFLAAACSRTEARAQRLTTEFAPEGKVYEHYEDMLSDSKVDIISICMPNYLHAREAILALEAGKHLS